MRSSTAVSVASSRSALPLPSPARGRTDSSSPRPSATPPAAVASLLLLVTVNHFRPSLRGSREVLRPLRRFSGGYYVGNLLTLLPTFVIPLIVLDRVGVHEAAYYYIAYLLVSLLFADVFAVEQAFLSEGSHEEQDLRVVMRRSWRLLALFCIPATVVLMVAARWLLLLFGHNYSVHGTGRADRDGHRRDPVHGLQLALDRAPAHRAAASDRGGQRGVRLGHLRVGVGPGASAA